MARISKSRASIERAQEKAGKSKTTVYGRYFVAEPKVLGGGDFPTREEWIEEQNKKRGNTKVSSKFDSENRDKIVHGRK